jgi:hypothetical protein
MKPAKVKVPLKFSLYPYFLISIFFILSSQMNNASAATGATKKNIDLQPKNSIRNPPRNGANVSPRYTDMAFIPIAKPRPPKE